LKRLRLLECAQGLDTSLDGAGFGFTQPLAERISPLALAGYGGLGTVCPALRHTAIFLRPIGPRVGFGKLD
jgi:hypothetical protein